MAEDSISTNSACKIRRKFNCPDRSPDQVRQQIVGESLHSLYIKEER